ncbi:MAG: hypothetical protein DDT31_01715 [Syntrophomonadaceae bacterium]|nr:hypothetical protein [Bacillota bacterium]
MAKHILNLSQLSARIKPTNNVAEQAIRFVVIDRVITQGTWEYQKTTNKRAVVDSYSHMQTSRAVGL